MTTEANFRYIKPIHGRLTPPVYPPAPGQPPDLLGALRAQLDANTAALYTLAAAIQGIATQGQTPTPSGNLVDQRKVAESGQYIPYSVKTFDLTTARTDFEIVVEGDFVHAWTDGSYDNIGLKYNNAAMNDLIYFARRNPVSGFKFWKLYLTNSVQAGKTLDLLIGRDFKVVADNVPSTPLGTSALTLPYTSLTPPAAGTFYTTLVDCRSAKNLLFYITNTSDVAITVQAVGSIANSTTGIVYVGAAMPVIATTGIISVGLNLQGDDWHPFIGLELIVPAGAAVGTITVSSINRV